MGVGEILVFGGWQDGEVGAVWRYWVEEDRVEKGQEMQVEDWFGVNGVVKGQEGGFVVTGYRFLNT